MITTVTLNPAVDKTLEIHGFKQGSVNRVQNSRVEAGGKGINVSKALKSFGEDTLATGFLGGESGNWINNYLKDQGIQTDFVCINNETRTNIKIVDTETSSVTDINDRGKIIEEKYSVELYSKIRHWAPKSKVMVFAGSIPEGLPDSTYSNLIKIAGSAGCKAILDAEGDKLLEGINAMPYMIKPNIHELESSLNIKIRDEKDIIYYCRDFIGKGVRYVVVSMGEEGAILISKNKVLKAEIIPVRVKSTVGAGDSMVAAFAYGIMKEYAAEETFKLAVAAAALSVSKGNANHQIREIEDYKGKVRLISL